MNPYATAAYLDTPLDALLAPLVVGIICAALVVAWRWLHPKTA